MSIVVHHIELWTMSLEETAPSFDWLLTELGWLPDHDPAWPVGRIWRHPRGVYLVLEQSPDVSGAHDRTRAGLNHLALGARDREQLDNLRGQADQHGWREMFSERYPHAGGPDNTALYIENNEGFEIEVVVC
ncbi:MAG: glyoxalase [Actinomyces urogenitalis]|uniref:VOC family protein n=1 Tax=Actinomyces urogenitalis TaxID=103621 RepID=UPI002A7F9378|nr:VOC family protein [Actinomyces urogenitalis]MDY3678741.1 glyoxalase [Actinomyces urogenitalis]